MGYYLQAIIGNQQTLVRHASDYQNTRVVLLAQDIAIIPLSDELYDEIAYGEAIAPFEKLSRGVEEWIKLMSMNAPVAYIEAEFFGGTGGQSAVAWSVGSRVLGPIHTEDAINQTLRLFRVKVESAHDEFAAVGLGRHRKTRDWTAS